ncbi:MAG: hypothetical protein KA746_08790 [Pyrinomonadaceae bacterium]|nr:hypothetical protein [Pyrinomonadaceae bacterium]MBP6212454.1 hypothetical protein [Pyrinomonadaceae bacterium]
MKKLFFTLLLTSVSAFTVAAQAKAQAQAPDPLPAATPQPTYVRPTAEKRFKRYVKDTVGPQAWIGIVSGAAFATASNSPEEWGRSGEGFGRRVASNFGRNVVRNTVIYGLDEALKLDSTYYRSPKSGVGSRVGNALISAVTARKANGKRTVGIPRIVGTYTADVVANQFWYPARFDWKDGMKRGGISLAANAAFNLVREFIFRK